MRKITFPENFIWGIGNGAYQSEGAWNEDGKGESIWDRYGHIPGNVWNGENGDVTTDFYHRYQEDIALLASLGIRHFRMSVAWTRILPDGKGAVNPKGIAFYHDVFAELKKYGIEPMVTLYMWDLPQKLQDAGGWANRETADCFERYARILFQEYGEEVSTWVTFDEPFCCAFIGNYLGTYAPGLHDFSTALQVSYHMLLAHGRAVNACHELLPGAKIGIALNLSDCKSATDQPADIEAARRADGYRNRWFMDPLYKGRFPEDMLELYYPGLAALEPEQLIARTPVMSAAVNEVVLVKCKSSEYADKAQEILQARIDYQVGDETNPGGAWYPESIEQWEKTTVQRQGNYLALLAVADTQSQLEDIFNQAFA